MSSTQDVEITGSENIKQIEKWLNHWTPYLIMKDNGATG